MTDAVEKFELEGKNLTADKHAFETKLRRDMQGLVRPLVEQGGKHKEQFVHNIHHLNDHEGRLSFLEYTIFKSDKSEDRFEEVLRKLAELMKTTAVDIQGLRNDWIIHKEEITQVIAKQDKKLERVDQAEAVVLSVKDSQGQLGARFQQHQRDTEDFLQKTMAEFRASLKAQETETRNVQDSFVGQNKRLDDQYNLLKDLEATSGNHGKYLDDFREQITTLQYGKTDQLVFDANIMNMNSKLNGCQEYTELTRNMVQGCENYLEKYQPLFAQRQIQEILEHVLSSTKEKYKLKKFIEAKAVVLTEKILDDHGAPDLQGLIDNLHDGLQ